MLVLLSATPSYHGLGVLLRAGVSLRTYCILSWRPLSAAFLTELSTYSLFDTWNSWELLTSSWIVSSRRSFSAFILLWYRIDDAFEWVEDSLELILLEEADLPLMMSESMFISILDIKLAIVLSSQMVNLVFLYFYFLFLFSFHFIFLFLEQLGLGLEVISHTVTSVIIWWCGHNIGHETWENEVEGSRINDIIQHGYPMLTSCSTHGHLG